MGGTHELYLISLPCRQKFSPQSKTNEPPYLSRVSTISRAGTKRSRSTHPSTLGNHGRDGVSRMSALGWRLSSATFRVQIIPAQRVVKSKRGRRFSTIVSESADGEDNNVGVFLKDSLQPTGKIYLSENSRGFWTWNPMKLMGRIADHADDQKEMGMKKRRAFYRAEDWTKHRSSKRHLRHILSTFKSRVVISLIPPVTTLTAISAVIATYNTLVDVHVLPFFFPILHTSSLPYQLTAPALALLLVFRTEASYSRYDEARKTWTKLFACTKDFSRQCLSLVRNPQDVHRKRDLQQYIMAFPVALKCHLLDETHMYEDLKRFLDEDDLAVVMNSDHRPNCLIQLMTQTLLLLHIDENHRAIMDANITQFNEGTSVCERLVRSPIPLSYTRLTSRALILWHLTYPLVLWDDCKWMMVFATFFSASTLFGIEEVGVLIEEPFPMLSLERMCAAALENVEELVEMARISEMYLKSKERKLASSAGSVSENFPRSNSNGVPQYPSD